VGKYIEYGFDPGQECWIVKAYGKKFPYDEYDSWYDQGKE